MNNQFHVLTVGWELQVIRRLADPVEAATGFKFSHLLDPSVDRSTLGSPPPANFHFVRDGIRTPLPQGSRQTLAELEGAGIPTVHNMIMGDARVKTLQYEDALDYASFLAARFEELFLQIRPSIVLGGFDGLHSGIAMAVARKIGT